MNIIKNIHKKNAIAPEINDVNYLKGRIGFWGIVTEVNSRNNSVTVVSDTGYELKNIPVVSGEWVTVDNNKNYIPSQRNLPPVNSRVFVLTPTYTAVGAFVLCSGFSRGDENIRTLWAKSESEMQDKNNCRETKTQGGWDVTEEYANGNFKAESISTSDGNITITLNTTKDDNKSQVQEASIKAWNNSVVINKDGISITDKTGNKVLMTSSNIQVLAKDNNKLKIGNSVDTLYGLLNDLIGKLNGGTVVTSGTSTNQSVTAGQFATIVTKLGQILE
ncbi:MAG: hypothetical protein J5710_14155 [Treponema sp.]|nr:hypothetical protein [Treponema sp.]